MIFYISDTHFENVKAIDFDSRPFADIDDMRASIIRNWNNRVSDADTVYILGDFCDIRSPDVWASILKHLNGRKVLIRGNHDFQNELPDQVRLYLEDGGYYREINDEDRSVILCHYPIPFHNKARSKKWFMVYGHTHNSPDFYDLYILKAIIYARAVRYDAANKRQWYNCCCTMPWVDYTPRTLDELIKGESEARKHIKKQTLRQIGKTLRGKKRFPNGCPFPED